MRILILIIFITFVFSCNGVKKRSNSAKIEFEHLAYDLQTIRTKDSATCLIKFLNKGMNTLNINKVSPSCSCVRVDWPHVPIAKNDSGEIKVVYYSEHPSVLSEVIYVYYNGSDSPILISISGIVEDVKSSEF
ncbi:MAG: DUF1573 domain-containing protein [Prolixibacteraceae bacterium]|jgi:hypothetical protein|nr:DUF1573 domain-containing protein [Prolixibacteraceae bacterium]